MNFSRAQWVRFYQQRGLAPSLVDSYVDHAEALAENDLPPILSLGHLAALLGRHPQFIASATNEASKFYREFSVKKKAGGQRKIAAPYPSLLYCQRWVLDNILTKLPVSKHAHGCRSGRDIKSHVIPHKDASSCFIIDLSNFFPSIALARCISVFSFCGYSDRVALILAKLCCLHGSLPQGAPTSGYMSNLVCRKLDARLVGVCDLRDLTYTRYVDDICISGGSIPTSTRSLLLQIVESEGFAVNLAKTRYVEGGRKKTITGLRVWQGNVKTIPKWKKRVMREAYFVEKFGVKSHMDRRRISDPLYIDRLIGKLVFISHVEGGESINHQIQRLRQAKDVYLMSL